MRCVGSHKTYVFASESAEERAMWVQCIMASMAPPPVYALRQVKKDKVAMQVRIVLFVVCSVM